MWSGLVSIWKLGARIVEQIDIGTFDELRCFDSELEHQFVRLLHTGLDGLIFLQHNFQFKEVAQIVNPIEVHPCAADQEQRAVLLHAAYLTIGSRQGFAKVVGR